MKPRLGLLLALTCVGCTVGPDFRTPDPPAATRYVAGDAPRLPSSANPERDIPAEWWTIFRSRDIDTLVRDALAHSPTLDQARARLAEAQELRTARAGAVDYPAVDAAAGAKRQRIDPTTVGFPQAPNPGPFTVYSLGIDVSYVFDIAGGNRREIEGLSAQVDYRSYELEAARLALAGNVVTTAIQLAAVRSEIASTQAILDAQNAQLEIGQARFAAGAISELDLRNQQALVAETRAALPPLRARHERAIHLLAIFAGRAPSEATVPTLTLADVAVPHDPPLTLPSALVRQRPDIRASEALLHEASADVGVATANLYPRLAISASLATSRLRVVDLFGNGINVWNIGANLVQPLFHGGELQARKRAAIAAYEQAEAAYRQTVLQGIQDVADVLRSLEADAEANDAQAERSARANQAYRITLARFELGGVSHATLLDAERLRTRAESDRVQAAARRLIDTAALFQALGGGWGTDPRSATQQ